MSGAKDEFEIATHPTDDVERGAGNMGKPERAEEFIVSAHPHSSGFSLKETGSALAGGFIAASLVGLGGIPALTMSAAAGAGYLLLKHLPNLQIDQD